MRDLVVPTIFVIICVLTIWLGIAGSFFADAQMQDTYVFIKDFQTLIAACIAVAAAGIAWWNTTRTIRHAAQLERQRRARKQAALRAVLPHALSAVSNYAEQSDKALQPLHAACEDGLLHHNNIAAPKIGKLDTETVTLLKDFIEYSEHSEANLIEKMLAHIQIHHSRMKGLAEKIKAGPNDSTGANWVEQLILDAACTYAWAGAAYDYARRRTDALPEDITWDNVRSALNNLRMGDDEEIRELREHIDRLEQAGAKPGTT